MKIANARSRAEIVKLRETAYLKAWPAAQQLEALQDAANGRPEKKLRMEEDFARIRLLYPWPIE